MAGYHLSALLLATTCAIENNIATPVLAFLGVLSGYAWIDSHIEDPVSGICEEGVEKEFYRFVIELRDLLEEL